MAKITFSDENQAGDIPAYEFKKEELTNDYSSIISDILESRNGKVIVSFQSWREADYELEHNDIHISNCEIESEENFLRYISLINCKEIDYAFFCFNTYEEAFKYCIDLKEGL